MYVCVAIQIQHLLKLNWWYGLWYVDWFIIQIQHLLKLNYDYYSHKINKKANSNTTLVKVKLM